MIVALVSESALQQRITSNALGALDLKEILTPSDGQAALDLIDDGLVDVLITDKQLPDMSGLELAQQVRSHQGDTYTPILLIGDQFTRQQAIQAIQAGVNQILIKPVHPEDLRTKIDAVRNLRRWW